MAFFATFILLSGLLVTSSAQLYIHSIRPNFTASFFQLVDQAGAFLQSPNATFKASIANPKQQLPEFYFSVIHSPSNTIVWTANRNRPISESAKLLLTLNGLLITDGFERVLWSTPNLISPVAFMQLEDSGNLVLLDQGNVSLWQSFDYPTDTLVMGQILPVGIDLSVGDYQLTLTSTDAVLQWNGMTYWLLSMEIRAFKDSNVPLSFMTVNGSGLYWLGDDGSRVVFRMTLPAADGSEFIFAKLRSNGKFSISSYGGSNKMVQNYQFPAEDCRIPSICGKIGLCSSSICSCPPAFHSGIDGCVPINPSFTLPEACNTSNGSETNYEDSYLKIGDSMDYFSTGFVEPLNRRLNLSYCQLLCSQNCSCLGVLHENSSGACYPIQNNVGSIFSSTFGQESFSGYVKTMIVTSNANPSSKPTAGRKISVPGLVLISSSGLFLLIAIVVGFLWWGRRKWHSSSEVVRLGSKNSSSADFDIKSIPGLPVRLEYEELVTATDNFKTQIGSGGFGTVYKGILPNRSVVAVKKITDLGVDGKRDFCTEIAIIGQIRHINLVKLKGFCVQGKQRFLVMEYMNRGSLDHAIFDDESVVEWKERLEIALGTARGLAYLHSGCQHKIIHCDVKPENILLRDNFQVKLSDFGISKLLTPEQSNLLTTMRGTRGYLAPEWLTSSGISDKCDVYSYGMVLLEIVRGRRNFSIQVASNSSSRASSSLKLQRTYFPLLALEMHVQKKYLELADPRLEGRAQSEEVEMLVRVALCCVQLEPTLRPTMSNVVGMLEGSLPLGQPRIESLNYLRFYGQRYAEAVTKATDGCNGRSEFILDHQPAATSRV